MLALPAPPVLPALPAPTVLGARGAPIALRDAADTPFVFPESRELSRRPSGSRLVVVAKDQLLLGVDPDENIVYTDPIAIDGWDRATAMLTATYGWPGATNFDLNVICETSNDGESWLAWGPAIALTLAIPVPSNQPVLSDTKPLNGAFMRFRCRFRVNGAGIGAVSFSLHVLIDHA